MADAYRFTITATPMTEAELQEVIDFVRARHGRKHLIHVIGRQPSGTHLADAPEVAAVPTHDELVAAIADPGQHLPRGDEYREPVTSWSARAVASLLKAVDRG